MEIKGRNLVDGLPKNVVVHSEDVREALLECLVKITDAIKETLERTPPELSADIIDRGITLTGGGALLRGLDKLIQSETGIDVHVAENPLDCVATGAGAVLGPCGCAARRAGHRRGPYVTDPARSRRGRKKRTSADGTGCPRFFRPDGGLDAVKDFFDTWKFRILIAVAVFLAGLMLYAAANGRLTAAPQELLSVAVAPFQKVAAVISGGVASVWDKYTSIDETMAENEALREENAQLRRQLADYDQLKAENEAYKNLAGIQEDNPEMSFVSAFVIGRGRPGRLRRLYPGQGHGQRGGAGAIPSSTTRAGCWAPSSRRT